ncbi:MAG: hypothetical protein Q4B28_01550 [bacterium]|nr:hypothetical protein [bacterium]
MQIKFSTSRLELLALGDRQEEIRAKLSLPILKKYRQVLVFISAPDTTFLSLWNKKSFNLEKIQDHWSIRLNDQRRLEIAFGKNGEILVVDILQISNHYKEIIR